MYHYTEEHKNATLNEQELECDENFEGSIALSRGTSHTVTLGTCLSVTTRLHAAVASHTHTTSRTRAAVCIRSDDYSYSRYCGTTASYKRDRYQFRTLQLD